MDIEQIATTTVKARIARTNLLSAFISDGDKEPSWDGHIYIYENESKKKTFLHGQRIAVQVKGKRMKQLDKQHITYHVAIADLQNYLIHGVVFFVIGIDDKCNTRSYYTLLHPIKIKKILETTSKRQKVNIHCIASILNFSKLQKYASNMHQIQETAQNSFIHYAI